MGQPATIHWLVRPDLIDPLLRVLLNNSASPVGGGGGSDTPPFGPPLPLKWLGNSGSPGRWLGKFFSGPSANQTFFLAPLAPLTTQGLLDGGLPPPPPTPSGKLCPCFPITHAPPPCRCPPSPLHKQETWFPQSLRPPPPFGTKNHGPR